MTEKKTYTQKKRLSLADALKFGLSLSTAQILSWESRFGFNEGISWEDSTDFRHFCYQNVLVDRLVAHGFLEEVKPKTYSAGQTFKHGTHDVHIIAQVGPGMVALVSLINGNRFTDPIKAMNGAYRISESEFIRMQGTQAGLFAACSNPLKS